MGWKRSIRLTAIAALLPLACGGPDPNAADYELVLPERDSRGGPAVSEDAHESGESGENGGRGGGDAMGEGEAPGSGDACPFAAGAEPQKKAVFAAKWPDQDTSIEDETLRLIRAAVPGSKIRIAMQAWTRTSISNALADASKRGVDVRAVTSRQNLIEDPPGSKMYRYTDAVKIAKDELGTDRVILCNETKPGSACIGDGVNQNKFLLFSELCDGSKNVVVQSSGNLTDATLRDHNNMLVIRDDAQLFGLYDAYWQDLAAQKTNLSYYRSGDGTTGTRAFFFPRAGSDATTDTVYRILEGVECTSGSRIRVAMSYWTMERSRIVDILAAKKARGCDVKILVDETNTSAALKSHLAAHIARSDFIVAKGIHHKYLLVDSQYVGEKKRLVWTGSHNYTGPALRRNDETLLRVDDAAVFAAYQANWDAMWKSNSP